MSNRAKWFITTREKSSKHVKENQLNMVQVNNRKHNKENKGWWEMVGKLSGCTKAIKHLSRIFDINDINTHFREINTNPNYVAPTELGLLTSHDAPRFSENSVFIALFRIKRTAPGPDNITFWAWKKFSLELASAITHIYNTSLATRKIPARWKSANIGPIPKETNTTSLDQLRAISVTDMIMRLFERLAINNESSKSVHTYIHSDQYAYRDHCSTEMALLHNQHTWMKWLDDPTDFARVLSFDVSKAFHSVSHAVGD